MAFTDLLDLRTAVVEQTKRPDIADVFPRLVLLAESWLNRNLKCQDQFTRDTLTFASGTAALPVDFQSIIGIYDANGREYTQQTSQLTAQNTSSTFYSIAGGNIEIMFADGDWTIEYYAQIPTISGSMTATNWLLSKYPHLYLWAVTLEAAKYIRDVELATAARTFRDEALTEAKGDDQVVRYARAPVRVQGVNP